jgi:iron complex outermembrane receptor protein
VNAPEKRKVRGVELDVTLAPVDGLLLSANYVYTDAPTTPVRNIFSGAIEQIRANFTPKHAATFAVDYRFPRFSFGQLRANMNLDTAGNYYANNTVNFKAEKAMLLGGRVTLGDISFLDNDLEFALWGKNLTNTRYNLFDFRVAGRNTVTQYNDPRTYGFEMRARF